MISAQQRAEAIRERLWYAPSPQASAAFRDAMRSFALSLGAAERRAEEAAARERARVLAMALDMVSERPTVRAIMRAVQDHYGVSIAEMQSPQKTTRIALARQVVMYLAKEHSGATNREIGRPMGHRDPTTCYHGHQTIARKLKTGDRKLAADIAAIKAALNV